jgi:hypothetical protein
MRADDPETGAAEVTFFGVPRVDASDAHVDHSRLSSSYLMAGAGRLVSKRTVWVARRHLNRKARTTTDHWATSATGTGLRSSTGADGASRECKWLRPPLARTTPCAAGARDLQARPPTISSDRAGGQISH